MKWILPLCALVGLAAGCGDDDEPGRGQENQDAAVAPIADAGTDGGLDASAAAGGVRVENVGATCTLAGGCSGAGATCLTSLGQSNLRFDLPGGYCTATCGANAECGTGGGCPFGEIARDPTFALDIASIAQVPSVCLDRCTATEPTSCRTGYVCRSLREIVPASIRMSPVGFLLIGPNFTDTFCIPPVEIMLPDAGVAADGGLRSLGAPLGMDAGL